GCRRRLAIQELIEGGIRFRRVRETEEGAALVSRPNRNVARCHRLSEIALRVSFASEEIFEVVHRINRAGANVLRRGVEFDGRREAFLREARADVLIELEEP